MYGAKILADSVNPVGDRLTTFELTYPRFVHSEFMTHRMISRNSASSRAIPISKMIERVIHDPVEPVWWGKNQSGMQAREELDAVAKEDARTYWHNAREVAVRYAKCLDDLKVHKQIVNRLLEPWMWITVIASATDWWHFFNLRAHPDAQPEIAHIARMARELYESNVPIERKAQTWHLPLVQEDERNELMLGGVESWVTVSAGRCARVSYLTHDGKRDPIADAELAKKLMTAQPMHASPFEHQAYALDNSERIGNFTGWVQYRKLLSDEYTNFDMREVE